MLAGELTKVFESQGVHLEALGALRLFKEAVESEAATAELARRVLGYPFRARHDQDLRFRVMRVSRARRAGGPPLSRQGPTA